MKRHIPNAITSANLLCGCIAITQIADGNLQFAALLVLLGAFFDFFDGMAARLLKVSSPIGAELDSLADMVTFGVVPAYLAFEWLNELDFSILNYAAFLIAIFSGVRLAKFNVDTRQTESFIGLPTPANALFWISIPLMAVQHNWGLSFINTNPILPLFENFWFLIIAILVLSYLLVAELPLLSLKFKNLSWKSNKFRFILVISSVLLFAIFLFAAIPFILLLYVILSIIQTQTIKQHEV